MAAPIQKHSLRGGSSFGDFRIIRFLGAGGTSEVYLATDNLERRVALKVLKEEGASLDETFVKRFDREGKIIGELDHPNIVRIYTAGVVDGKQYIANEYLEGETLKEKIEHRTRNYEPPFQPDEIVEMLLQLAGGLRYMHQKGIIHRDLNPNNIMVTAADGTVKILDFGIAKKILSEGTIVTETQTAPGTLAYMAPEQLRMLELSPKTDQWGLGCTGYELSTLRKPYKYDGIENQVTRLQKITEPNLEDIKKFNPEFLKENKTLEAIIRKTLDPDPDGRYDETGELYNDLLRCKNNELFSVKQSLRRRLGMTRRQFMWSTAAAVAGVSAGGIITVNRVQKGAKIRKEELAARLAYESSIYSTLDKIQAATVDTLDKVLPLLEELYPKLCNRLDWLYETIILPNESEELRRILTEKPKDGPSIYPFASATIPGSEGSCFFLAGDSSIAGYVTYMLYNAFEEFERREKSVKSEQQKKSLQEKNQAYLDAFFRYAKGLYYVRQMGTMAVADQNAMVMNRFYPPADIVLGKLQERHPDVILEKQKETKEIVSKYAEAVKLVIEKRYNPFSKFINLSGQNTKENTSAVSADKDREIAELLCQGFRMLDLSHEVLTKFPEYGNSITNIKDFLDIILNDADAKIDKLVKSELWQKTAQSKAYAGLITGLIRRQGLLEDILKFKQAGSSVSLASPGYSSSFLHNFDKLDKEMKKEEWALLREKKENYNQAIEEMMAYFISNTPDSMICRYYLMANPDQENNPVDNIATLRFLEALCLYNPKKVQNINVDSILFRVLKNLNSRQFISGTNDLPLSKANPFGFVKESRVDMEFSRALGGTYIETDALYLMVTRELVGKNNKK